MGFFKKLRRGFRRLGRGIKRFGRSLGRGLRRIVPFAAPFLLTGGLGSLGRFGRWLGRGLGGLFGGGRRGGPMGPAGLMAPQGWGGGWGGGSFWQQALMHGLGSFITRRWGPKMGPKPFGGDYLAGFQQQQQRHMQQWRQANEALLERSKERMRAELASRGVLRSSELARGLAGLEAEHNARMQAGMMQLLQQGISLTPRMTQLAQAQYEADRARRAQFGQFVATTLGGGLGGAFGRRQPRWQTGSRVAMMNRMAIPNYQLPQPGGMFSAGLSQFGLMPLGG